MVWSVAGRSTQIERFLDHPYDQVWVRAPRVVDVVVALDEQERLPEEPRLNSDQC